MFRPNTIYHAVFSEPVCIRMGVHTYVELDEVALVFYYTTDESHTLCYQVPGAMTCWFVVGDWINKSILREVGPYEPSDYDRSRGCED